MPRTRFLQPLRAALALLAFAGCRPADPHSFRAYRGRNIQAFLAAGPKPLAVVDEPGGRGRTYHFECLREEAVAVLETRPPAPGPRPAPPWLPPARPGERALQVPALFPSVAPDAPRSRTVLRFYQLRILTDPAGIIRDLTWEARPPRP